MRTENELITTLSYVLGRDDIARFAFLMTERLMRAQANNEHRDDQQLTVITALNNINRQLDAIKDVAHLGHNRDYVRHRLINLANYAMIAEYLLSEIKFTEGVLIK